jgi:hypothetical protein
MQSVLPSCIAPHALQKVEVEDSDDSDDDDSDDDSEEEPPKKAPAPAKVRAVKKGGGRRCFSSAPCDALPAPDVSLRQCDFMLMALELLLGIVFMLRVEI